jgi:heptosyltransferase III
LRIVIIRAGALGDTLMLMPVIQGLKKSAEIIIVGRRPGIDYLRPYVDQCIDIETSGWHGLFMEGHASPQVSPTPAPDHVVAFVNDPEGSLSKNLKAAFHGSAVNVFPVFPPEGKDAHIALYMAGAIRDAGLPLEAFTAFDNSFKSPLLKGASLNAIEKDYIVFHPGSGSRKKNYPPAFWLEVIKELKGSGLDCHGKFVLLLGPAEEGLYTFFADNLDDTGIEFKVLPEKEELISILDKTSVYIGHDSGITHLAAMMGVHVIALFKASSIERWRPLGPNVRIIKDGNYSLS